MLPLTAAQILLTLGDTEERRRYLNARATLQQLLKFTNGMFIYFNS